MCKTREMTTMLTATMDHKRALANTKAVILNHLKVHMKVETERITKTVKVAMSTDKEATIKCQMTSSKK